MATKTEVIVTCDLDGKAGGVETIEIAINGRTLELELCESCREKTVGKFLARIEPVARIQSRRRVAAPRAPRRRASAVETRAWLVANGYEVSSHGRISAEHLAAFESRQPALAAAS
jgi:nucleoid-associated protein Lsr2